MERTKKDAAHTEITTNLCAWGTSRAVRIPKTICEELNMDIGAALSLKLFRDAEAPYLVIKPLPAQHKSYGDAPYRSMDEVFAGYSGGYEPCEFDWGEDVGAEALQ